MPAPAGLDAGTASQLIRGVGRTRRMRCVIRSFGLTGLAMSIAIASGFAETASIERDAVLEALIRQEYAGGCSRDLECLLAVQGKPPGPDLMRRIRDLRYVRAIPADSAGTGLVFDIGPLHFVSGEAAEVYGEMRGQGGPVFTSCTYFLRRTRSRWRLDGKRTSCAIT